MLTDHETPEYVRPLTSITALLGRLMWFFIGPAALIFITYGIVKGGTGWLTALDAAFFVVVALMIGGRWREQRSGSAITADGRPATWQHFRRYVLAVLPAAVAIWVAANVLGNHLLAE